MHHQSGVWQQVLRQWLGINQLEERMSATENALNDLNDATNEVAAEIDELRGAIAATDQATADQLGQVAARLRGLAADPENPVPDNGGGDVVTDPAPVSPDEPQA